MTADNGARYDRIWDWIEEHVPAEPLWYLDQLGVDPSRQGEGLGRALVRFGLDRAAEAGLPAFLETARERNLGSTPRWVPRGRRGNRAGQRATDLVHASRPGAVREPRSGR